MDKNTQQSAPTPPAAETPQRATAPAKTAFSKAASPRPKRTTGEWLVDWLVYPIVNNFAVFFISVGATYLTHRGDTVGKEGSTIREVGAWFKRRGEWMKGVFQDFGMNEKQADTSKMVFFSFFDGTFVAPFVKLLEDRREKMAKAIDSTLGTKPQDESAYKVEPKQSWGSVINGRLATSLIVVPTAVALEKKKVTIKGVTKNLNDHMFDGWGAKLHEFLENKTSIKARFPKLDLEYFSKTMVFEAFYTTVCTAGLYVISRFIAKQNKEHKRIVEEYHNSHKASGARPASTKEAASPAPANEETPHPHVSETTHMKRVAEPMGQEITA